MVLFVKRETGAARMRGLLRALNESFDDMREAFVYAPI